MIWKIAKKEFLLNLMTFKFAVGTILCVVLMTVFMPVLANDYQQRLKDYNVNVAANEAELGKVKVYKNITPTIYRPPSVLSVFSEGAEKRLDNSVRIEFDKVPKIAALSTEVNPFFSIFPTLDVMLIFKIIMSVLALLMVYDTVAGECESGTLKLMLSGAIARYQVLLGKLLAGQITLVIPITIAFIVGLLILEFSQPVDLAGSDWIRIGLIYIASLIFIAAMYNVGLLFSCLVKKSATSLTFVLLFWVIFLFVIPNANLFLVNKIKPLEPREKIDVQIKSLIKERDVQPYNNPNDGYSSYDVGGAFGRNWLIVGSTSLIESRKKWYPLYEPLLIKYAGKISKVERNYLNGLLKQKNLATNLSRISPISLYENIMSALAGTDLASFQYFMDRAKIYRNEVIEYIRSKTNGFSSSSCFTPCNEEDVIKFEKEVEALMQVQNQADAQKLVSEHMEWRKRRIPTMPSLYLQDLSQFICPPQSILKSLKEIIFDLAILVFINILFFTLSFVLFLKYDVR